MAFEFLNNLFLSEDKKAKITHIMSLIAVISADGKVTDEETILLNAIAKREGLTDEEFNDILKGKKIGVKFAAPKNEEQKLQYLKDAVAMMLIDGNLDPEELKLCIGVGKRLGLPAEKVSETITGIISKHVVNGMKQDSFNKQQTEKHSEDDGYEAAGPITNQRVGLTGLLPSFTDMKKDATAEEVMRVAALTNTILNLTFKNPFPIDQDPVFSVVLKANNEWAKEQLATGRCKIEAHEELKETYEGKYSAEIAKQMMEIDYWNQRMIEHAALTKTLGPKPAFQCLQAALNLTSFAGDACAILIVNYSHLLLKCSMLKLQNPAVVGDIKQVLKQASSYLHFDEGMEYAQQ